MLQKRLLLGDEAVALGALHAGLSGVYAYPGTPSTEITEFIQQDPLARERGVRSRWCTNEKTAMEAALGMSYAGKRALVCMKHVGMNVCADAFVNAAVTGVKGGLVVVAADDPSMHSSQNEQDSRFYGQFALVPILEPSDQQECYDMMSDAKTDMNRYSAQASSCEEASDQRAALEQMRAAELRYQQCQNQLQQVQAAKAQALRYLQATRSELTNVIRSIEEKLPKFDQSINTFEQMSATAFGQSAAQQLPRLKASRESYQKNLNDARILVNRIDSVFNRRQPSGTQLGDGEISALRQKAVRDAWAREKQLVLQGKGTRDWTVAQQAELIQFGTVRGFEGQHMLNVADYPEHAGDPENIQFLTYEEHFYGAHGGNFRNETSGRFDPATGEMVESLDGSVPSQRIIPLTDTYDPSQYELTTQLGRAQGYNRREDIQESRERHRGEKSKK